MSQALRRSIVIVLCGIISSALILFFLVANTAHAQANAAIVADTECNPVIPSCPMNQVPGANGCQAGLNKFMAPCSASFPGGSTAGICILPNECQAVSASGLGGGGNAMSSLGQLAQTVGQILGQLMQGSGGGSGSGDTGTTAASCTSSYYTESTNPSPSDPCAQYIPSTNITGTCPIGETGTYPNCSSDTGSSCSLAQEEAGTCPITTGSVCPTGDTGTPSTGCIASIGTDTTNATLTPTPSSGTAPLVVSFTVTDTSGACPHSPIAISYGDSTTNQTVFDGASSDCQIGATQTLNHTYQNASTYSPKLSNLNTGATLQQSSVVVSSASNLGATDTTNATLTPTPSSGTAPLVVSFTVTDTSGACPHSPIAISYGDSTTNQTVFDGASSDCQIGATQTISHTYQNASTYLAAVINLKTGNALQQSSVIVTAAKPPVDTTNATLTPTPGSGVAPLAVSFTVTDTSGSCPHSPIAISYGDSTTNQTVFDGLSTDCLVGATQTFGHTYQNADTYSAELGNLNTGGTLQQSSIIVYAASNTPGTTDTTNGTLTPTPSSGTAPLTVSVAVNDTSGSCPHSPIVLSFGDNTADETVFDGATADCLVGSTGKINHTYQTSGNYTLSLINANTSLALQSSVVIVTASSTNNTGGTIGTYYTNGGSNGAPSIADVTGTFTQNSTAGASTTGPYRQGSVSGNIVTTPNGGTFTANSTNGDTEVAGFFGGNTIAGAVTALVSSWCTSRPWSTNFLANIFPPSFFDGLCTWAGYTVGPTAATQASANPQVSLTQTSVQQTRTPAKTTTPANTTQSPPAASTTLSVVPKVDIWAVPASVTLGARTTIYWNTQGVTGCAETSPDGSFSENTLSGGANTVPLTQATTYSISCVDTKGNPVTGYVTVSMAI